MCRIKFYSVGDLLTGEELIKLEDKLKHFDSSETTFGINDIVEFFNIIKYIEAERCLESWNTDFIKELKDYNKILKRIIGKFLSSISNINFIDIYNDCNIEYKDDFLELIEDFNVYRKIDSNTLKKLLERKNINIYNILERQKLVFYYGEVIRNYLLNENLSAEILLNKYIRDNRNKVFIPKELSLNDKEVIIENYINSTHPNINYLDLISKLRSSDELRVSNRIKIKAKRRLTEEQEKLFEESISMKREFSIVWSQEHEEVVESNNENGKNEFIYSFKWIEENKDYSTLLNNFIFLFEFVDFNGRISLLSKNNEMTTMEKVFTFTSKNSYKIGTAFNTKHFISILQMESYYEMLRTVEIRLEDIIKWFFEEYLVEEFEIDNFTVNIPSNNSSFFEKCRFILPEMEFILKQYTTYVLDGIIDQELLQMSSDHLIYKDIPSLIPNKYAYPTGEEFEKATYYLFSDQCMLRYMKSCDKKYKSFCDLLINEDIYVSYYSDRCISDLNWLNDNNYIAIDGSGKIELCEINKIAVLSDLYMNEFINYNRYPKELMKIVDDMSIKGLIEFEDKLFSRQESNYINYYLNKSTFDNSLDLRNMYSHGTQPNPNENFHKENYFMFLRLVILIIIKINDELDIKDYLYRLN